MTQKTRPKPRSRAVGVLVEGDPCPGTELLIRSVAAAAAQFGWNVRGIDGGFDGLSRRKPRSLDAGDRAGMAAWFAGSRRGTHDDVDARTDLRRVVQGHGLAGVIAVGGLDTMERAERLHRRDVPVIGVPKSVENDVAGTAFAFGFDTAVAIAVEALERLQASARTTGRLVVAEVRGKHTGWIALHAAVAGGAAAALLPEIPASAERICEAVRAREREAAGGTVVVAEGASLREGGPRTGAAEEVALALGRRFKRETRSIALSAMQLGGPPSAFDRLLAARLGSAAMRLVNEGLFGNMVGWKPAGVVAAVPLHQVTGRPRPVPTDSDLLRAARDLGIGFGD